MADTTVLASNTNTLRVIGSLGTGLEGGTALRVSVIVVVLRRMLAFRSCLPVTGEVMLTW